MAYQIGGDLRDDSQGGCLNQFGELRSDECRSEQCVGRRVNDQFRPSFEAIPVKGEECHCAWVTGGSGSYREPFCSGLTFRAPHPDYLRVSEDNLRQTAGIAGSQLVLPQFSPRGPGRDDVGHDDGRGTWRYETAEHARWYLPGRTASRL